MESWGLNRISISHPFLRGSGSSYRKREKKDFKSKRGAIIPRERCFPDTTGQMNI